MTAAERTDAWDGRSAVLAACARALRREAHVLQNRPELTWQQFHNRLQWADAPLPDRLAAERERRSGPGARPWIHQYSRLRESEALFRTLSGHAGAVDGCAVSPDGTWIVSASNDGTLKIWDAASGSERAVLLLPGTATAVAFHPFALMVACGDAGGGVHLARLVGIDLGPLVVTAAAHDHELTVRCPACREAFPVDRDRLGTETTCPRPACGTRLRINPYVLWPLP